jgi:Spx/MgsR family transcriptional regulator
MYGISNCDTVKKARAWLESHDVEYEFVDFKKSPPTAEQLARWCAEVGLDTLINRRGPTWRKLPAEEQARAGSERGAFAVLIAHPSAIKRPVLERGQSVLVGFDAQRYARELGS